MTHIRSWQMRYSSTAVEFPQLRQLTKRITINYTKIEVPEKHDPKKTI